MERPTGEAKEVGQREGDKLNHPIVYHAGTTDYIRSLKYAPYYNKMFCYLVMWMT